MIGLWCAMSATRIIQPFSLSEALIVHGYVKYFLTPFLNIDRYICQLQLG